LGFIIVNESQQLLPYRQAALWREGSIRHVAALSGLAELDPTAPYMQWLSQLFRHLAARPEADDSKPDSLLVDPHALPPALAEEWQSWLPAHALWLRLGSRGPACWPATCPGTTTNASWQKSWHMATGMHCCALPRATTGESRPVMVASRTQQRRLLLVLLLLACLPIRLSVLARGEVTPQDPVLLRAPLSGVIDRIQVQPNQRVKAGDALFDLDATTLAGQFAMAAGERCRTGKLSRQRPAGRDRRQGQAGHGAGSCQAGRKSIAAEYTGLELQRLHVTAPNAGVVVFSDRNDWLGKAVTLGEKVMTLADPAHVELAAWLPAAEAIDVAPGGKITLYPNASPTESYDAEITRVAYKAEAVENGLLAYRLQARFLNNSKPRLGQMGTARVMATGCHSFITPCAAH
jgi:hypothetical protein